jgi:hypothetical protein
MGSLACVMGLACVRDGGRRAVGALPRGRPPLGGEVPHPQRLLKALPLGPAAALGRPRRAAFPRLLALRVAPEGRFFVALAGLILIVAGDVGQFWLGLDDRYIMTAPAYRTFRIGLVVFAVGSIAYGVASGKDRTLPVWGALPFAIGGLCGLLAFWSDLGQFGAVLWILFGLAWAWLSLAALVEGVSRFRRKRRTANLGFLS